MNQEQFGSQVEESGCDMETNLVSEIRILKPIW